MNGEPAPALADCLEELRRERENWGALVDRIGDGLVVVDEGGFICFLNRSAAALLQRKEEELIGKPFGFPVIQGETTGVNLLARDGSILAAEMRATRVTWNGAAGWLILIRDVTEVLRSKREIQQLNENLATQVRDLEQFTYSLAHDLRSPVRAVLGFLELLREDRGSALSPNALQLLEKVRNRTSFMDELICGMLDFARSSLQPLAMKRVDLNEVVESVIGRMSESAPQVREIVRSGLLPTVDGDPLLLTQVFTNLISNGVKYSSASEQPVVLVYQMPCEDCYHIAVADNGIGFPPEKASSLFNVFTRLQPNHSEGVGVGLAIVRNIVVRHGGRIWAEGTPGEGARFHIELPKGAPEKLPAATSTSGTG